MTGAGAYADLLARRFELAKKRLGFHEPAVLNTRHFRPPVDTAQMDLFESV